MHITLTEVTSFEFGDIQRVVSVHGAVSYRRRLTIHSDGGNREDVITLPADRPECLMTDAEAVARSRAIAAEVAAEAAAAEKPAAQVAPLIDDILERHGMVGGR